MRGRLLIALLAIAALTAGGAAPALAASGDVTEFGYNLMGSRSYASEATITAANVHKLKLAWAFAVPGAQSQESQPAIVGGTLYFGGTNGVFYALNAKTGKTVWKFDTATVTPPGPLGNQLRDGPAVAGGVVYFGDKHANMYALSANTGKLLWKTNVDPHPAAVMTSSPVIYKGSVIVGVSSIEELFAAAPTYPCCTFRGSLVRLDAKTGKLIWRYRPIPINPGPIGPFQYPALLYGPSGDAVWSTPAIDPATGNIYIGLGNTYTGTSNREDSMVDVSFNTGKEIWARQLTSPDAWNLGCVITPIPDHCPVPGKDFDFGASPNLFKAGKRLLVGEGQKSAVYHVLDAKTGKIVWQMYLNRATGLPETGGLEGIEWGTSFDGTRLYVATDIAVPGTLFALNPATGRLIWKHPEPLLTCFTGGAALFIKILPIECLPALGSAVASSPGLVWEGAADGKFHAYDAATGKILWSFDTVRSYTNTVDHVLGQGGSIDGGGTVVANGMVYEGSGFTHFGITGTEMPGNMLLAFKLG
jgi:polyvinyl alcohol dehydrogenase (cytochrome)